ncbi:MAG: zinc-ribbon domain-containing protein [Clostridiales bacterium]|nr:zinc-ribbon domain-containing protein [Clostridiales bacterium]
MFCENCGAQIADGSAICPNCGAAVRVSPTTGEAVPVQPIQATPVQPVQPVYQQPVQPVYQQQPAYQQPIYQQPAAGGSKALAITALILGICGLVFCWIPVFGLLIAVAGLIVGIFALKNPNGKGMGITGFVLSIVGIVIGLSYTIALFGSSSAFSKNYSSLSRSLSRSRSRASSISRSLSRKKNYDIAAPDANLYIDGYVVSFGE